MPKSKEMISDSDSGSSEEEVKSKSKKQEKKKPESDSPSEQSESEEDVKSKKRAKKGKEDKGSNKKAKKETKSDNDQWDIGNNKHVTVRHFKGKLYVDIREMYMDKEGEMKPGKKGVCLNVENWRQLTKLVDEVDECIKSKS